MIPAHVILQNAEAAAVRLERAVDAFHRPLTEEEDMEIGAVASGLKARVERLFHDRSPKALRRVQETTNDVNHICLVLESDKP